MYNVKHLYISCAFLLHFNKQLVNYREPSTLGYVVYSIAIVIINYPFSQLQDSQYGLTVHYYIPTCFQKDTPSYYWRILLMTYTAFLQCLGIILAFQTRKVKISALNDSKYVAAIIYISSITLLTLLFTHFGFYEYINISYGTLNGVIFVNTTVYLGLMFCPKVSTNLFNKFCFICFYLQMINLYKDPGGKKIFEKSFSSVKDLSDKKQVKVVNTTTNVMESFKVMEPPDTIGGYFTFTACITVDAYPSCFTI